MILKGKNVILRETKLSDAKFLYTNVKKPEILLMLHMMPAAVPKSLAAEKKWLRSLPGKRKKKTNFVFVLTNKDGEKLGCIDIHDINNYDKRGELGFWLAKKYWGKGYGKDALKVIINFGFKKLKLMRLEGICYEFNTRSRRLQESVGLKLEGILRQHAMFKGKLTNSCFYSILRKEWKG